MKTKLPKEFKKKWIAALRSGKYKQGYHMLKDEHGYCCLGVACKIVKIKNDLLDDDIIPDNNRRYNKVPKILRGMASKNDTVKILTGMNDTQGYSFTKIADWIEYNL